MVYSLQAKLVGACQHHSTISPHTSRHPNQARLVFRLPESAERLHHAPDTRNDGNDGNDGNEVTAPGLHAEVSPRSSLEGLVTSWEHRFRSACSGLRSHRTERNPLDAVVPLCF